MLGREALKRHVCLVHFLPCQFSFADVHRQGPSCGPFAAPGERGGYLTQKGILSARASGNRPPCTPRWSSLQSPDFFLGGAKLPRPQSSGAGRCLVASVLFLWAGLGFFPRVLEIQKPRSPSDTCSSMGLDLALI